ncbi:TPA: hypothetical protein QCK30_000632 [Enterobacter sichuanensis]|uniref:Cysteine-rich CPCC domain-containing protein n=1 Tax=Enterobacter cloacae TaxID=550 RepID=A0AB37VAU2_ENTCL|nr:hypothetical protein [Enterobacter sichuanensis]RWT71428.1 hypothetical protein DN595_25470 [Enterobacter cloacae]HDR2842196.1 hypothetical protein [Enterobacter sichuanensis]HED6272275.1 hypothetical protein [Enterobacter sichuanensis]HEM8745260.1 hypothetical protein [Enterobacter sichuanensis]
MCLVCNWEDDPVQAEVHDYRGGANVMSLNEAREALVRLLSVSFNFLKKLLQRGRPLTKCML